jgi:glycosyltransferase 2 family protein
MERVRGGIRRLESRPVALSLAAIAIAAAVSALMAHAAGFRSVERVLSGIQLVWLAPLLGARLLSYVGYTAAHRTTLFPARSRQAPLRAELKTVAFGSAATSLEGGFSIDHRVMRGAGATPRQATIRVLNLGALELATLAPAAWVCALALLDSAHVQQAVTLPWAIGVPAGVLLALAGASRLSARSVARRGSLGRAVARTLDALDLLIEQARHPFRYGAAWAGMATYWACEMLSLWAALNMFGVHVGAAVVVLAYATGHVLTPRSLPLSGAGVTELLLPLALMWCGVSLTRAVPAVFAYRIALLGVGIPPAIAARDHIRRLVKTPVEQHVAS